MFLPKRRILTLAGAILTLLLLTGIYTSSNSTQSPTKSSKGISLKFETQHNRENATFVVLVRNQDVNKLASTITTFEGRFNQKFQYDWVFLNDEEFTEEFKGIISRIVSGEAKFGLISSSTWSRPSWIDPKLMQQSFDRLAKEGVPKASMESFHHMCRYESGFFFDHPLLKPYKYYWRVDPGSSLLCDVDVDVFKYLRENNLKYSFALANREDSRSLSKLWDTTLRWANENPSYIATHNLARIVTERNANEFSLCQFWSNFEIADMDFFRSEGYSSFFKFLDRAGGFYTERWTDSSVHTIAVALMLSRDEVAHLDFIGYEHSYMARTPQNFRERNLKCATTEKKVGSDFDEPLNCFNNFLFAQNLNSLVPGKSVAKYDT